MKRQSKEITIGKAVKYKKVKIDIAKIIAAYKSGKPVAQIALAIGYPPNTGNNRVRNLLTKCGLINAAARKKSCKKAAA